MQIIIPAKVSEANVSTSPPELHPEWISGDSYAQGDTVVYAGRVWEAQSATTAQPDLGAALPTPQWLDAGPSNALAAFDQRNSTASARNDGSDLVLAFTPGVVATSISLFGVAAQSGTVRVLRDGVAIFEESLTMRAFDAWLPDWWDYFYTDWGERTSFAFFDLEPDRSLTFEVTLTPANGVAAVAEIVAGTPVKLGDHQQQTQASALDFSDYRRDEFGNLTTIKRVTAPSRNFSLWVKPNQAGFVERTLRGLSGSKAVFVLDGRMDWMTTLGVVRDWRLSGEVFFNQGGKLQGVYDCNIEVEGVSE